MTPEFVSCQHCYAMIIESDVPGIGYVSIKDGQHSPYCVVTTFGQHIRHQPLPGLPAET
jgi:hypothetical protein